MAFQRPGVYVQETLNPNPAVAGPDSDSIAAFVGASDKGPTTPTLISSWTQYVKYFGSWNTSTGTGAASNDLPIAVYMFFQNGGSSCYVARAVGTSGATPSAATKTLYDRVASSTANTVTINALSFGTWGQNINVTVTNSTLGVTAAATTPAYFNLTVYYGGITDAYIVEQFNDLTMVTTDARYALSIVNGSSSYISLAVPTSSVSTATGANLNPPVSVINTALTGGNNGGAQDATAYSTTLTGFDIIRQSLILNLPGVTSAGIINASAIAYATGSTRQNDVFVIIDGVNDTRTAQLTLSASYTPTSYAAVYYPRLTIADPTITLGGNTAATKLVGPGGAIAGLFVATDASRGIHKAPAGIQARIAGAVSVAALTNDDLDALNFSSAPVNAIRYIPGAGIVVMGSRTLKTGYVDKYVPVRRTLIYLTKLLRDLTDDALFEPNDEALWRRLTADISGSLTAFWATGGLRGATPQNAFFVKVDAENNPQASIDNGEVHIEVGVALQRPAEFVVIKIGQYDGGTTVSVS
jgi:phage tail sheath protein FI